MYQVDDVVVYGNHGVCQVVEIGTVDLGMVDKEKLYYTLRPVYKKEAIIYAPVENQKTIMRPVISKSDAEELIRQLPDIETVWVSNEKERELVYKRALLSCDCKELVRIIKTIYTRRKERIQEGKKLTMLDERYFRSAETQLYEELAYAFGISKEDVGSYITSSVMIKA